MEKTPRETPVGVDDPYEVAGVCDHLTSDGHCRFAVEHYGQDREFATAREADDYACPVGFEASERSWEWQDCPHFRSTTTDRECQRCGLAERQMPEPDKRPLLEEHHLSYAAGSNASHGEDGTPTSSHEITVMLCRWCHAKVHTSWARITDDASPDPEAIAAREDRRSRELEELEFESAADRYESR